MLFSHEGCTQEMLMQFPAKLVNLLKPGFTFEVRKQSVQNESLDFDLSTILATDNNESFQNSFKLILRAT